VCNFVSDKVLSLFADGRLSEEEKSRIEAHLKRCAQCRHRLHLITTPKRVLKKLPLHTSSLSFESVLKRHMKRARLIRLVRVGIVLTAAASVLLATILFLLPGQTKRPSPQASPTTTVSQEPAPKTAPKPHHEETPKKEAHVEKPGPQKVPVPQPPAKQKPPERPPAVVKAHPKKEPVKTQPPAVTTQQTPLMFEDVVARFEAARKQKSLKTQAEALRIMGQIGTPQAETFLCRLALSEAETPPLRAQATLALADIGTKRAAETILQVGRKGQKPLKEVAVFALPSTLQWLIAHVLPRSKHQEERLIVARALRFMQSISPRRILFSVRHEQSEAVKLAVVDSMANRRDETALLVLAEMGRSCRGVVKRAAIESLVLFGSRAVKPLLRLAREDKNPLMRELAVRCLLETRTKEAALASLTFLRDSDRRLYGTVLKGLIDLTGQVFTTPQAWRRYLGGLKRFPPEITGEVFYPADFMVWDVPFWTRSVVFVLDCSSTSRRIGALESAVETIRKSVAAMPRHIRLNIVCYNANVLVYSHKGLLPVSKAQQGLERFLKAQLARKFSGADLYSALVTAIKLAPDDIILLTTGVFSKSRFRNLASLVKAVSQTNAKTGCRIHVLAYLATTRAETKRLKPTGAMVDALRMLAEINLGQFRYRWLKLQK